MRFDVSRSLNHLQGGLLGLCVIGSAGYDFFVINNEYSVLVSKDHCSINRFNKKKIPNYIIKETAKYLKYKKFHTELRDVLYVYNDEVIEDVN